MTSPWLKDYVLEELGSELRNPTTLGANTTRGARIGTAVTATATATATATTPRSRSFSERGSDRVRLVRILARGQGDGSVHRTNGNANGNGNGNGNGNAHGTDWWDIRKRGASPNLSLQTNAWLLVSDGSHSAKAYLEVRALKQIFDRDQENHKNNHSHNHNESLFFGRGCCVLLRDYSLDCGSFGGDRESGNGNDNVSGNGSGSDSVVFKVSSLEPKPGFGHHNNHGSTTIRPVMEEIDVLYGLRFLARKRQLEASAVGHGDQSAARKTAIRAMVGRVARDWDVAFGRLSRGLLRTTSATTSATATATTAHGRTTVSSEADVMELAERLSSTEEAIREWEAAKTEFGIDTNIDIDADTGTGTDANGVDDETAAEVEVEASENRTATAPTNTNAVRIRKTTTDSGGELRNGDRGDNEDGSENDDDDEDEDEDPSRLFIQNVLATQEEEEDEDEDEDEDEENEPSNLLLTQEEEKSPKTYSEKPVLPATRSPEKSGRNIDKGAIGDEEEDDKQSPSSKAMSCKLPAEQSPRKPGGTNTEDDEEEDERSVRAMRRKRSPVNQRQQQSEDATLRTPMKPRFKRPRAGSSDSGTLSRCTLDEAIDPSNRSAEWTKSTRKLLRRQKQQQQQRENQQELLQKSQTVWEFVKAQLFEPGRTTIHTSPEEIIGNHNNNNNNNNNKNVKNINDDDDDDDDELLLLATPTRTRTPIPMHRSMTPAATTTRGSSAFGSGDSAGTSLTFATIRTQHSLRVVNTASAEYYRRYGLTRWLNRNTFRQDDNNNNSDEDTDDCY